MAGKVIDYIFCEKTNEIGLVEIKKHRWAKEDICMHSYVLITPVAASNVRCRDYRGVFKHPLHIYKLYEIKMFHKKIIFFIPNKFFIGFAIDVPFLSKQQKNLQNYK